MERELKPFEQELQISHACCKCGELLPKGDKAMCAVISVQRGIILSAHRIAWCSFCWGMVPGSDETMRNASGKESDNR